MDTVNRGKMFIRRLSRKLKTLLLPAWSFLLHHGRDWPDACPEKQDKAVSLSSWPGHAHGCQGKVANGEGSGGPVHCVSVMAGHVPAVHPAPSKRRRPGLTPGHDDGARTVRRQIPYPDRHEDKPGHDGKGTICAVHDPAWCNNARRDSDGPVAGTIAYRTSSVTTWKPASVLGPKIVDSATSVASRPRAIRMRPMRGVLCRASKVCQCPPR
jgi:hypothetical protein